MAVRIGDTLKQINNADFPIVEAMDVAFESGDTLQELYDSGALSGGGGASYITLSQEEYDVLSDEEKVNGSEYRTYDTGHIYKLGIEYGKDGVQISDNETVEDKTWSSSKIAQQDGIKQVFYASSFYPTIFWILSDDTSGVFWFKHTLSRDDTVKTVEGYADLTNDKVIITTNVGKVNTKISTDSISGKKGVVIRITMMTGDVKITEARPLTATPTLITNR